MKSLVDGEILDRLRKCQHEGMVISIIDQGGFYQNDLLDIPLSSLRSCAPGWCMSSTQLAAEGT